MQSNDSNIAAFPAFPCTTRYIPLGSLEQAIARVSRAIDAHEPTALVIGPPGTGKSLLCGLIAKQYQRTHQVVVIGEAPLGDSNSMLRHLLHHLKVDKRSIENGDLHLALIDYVNNSLGKYQGLIIIVDEAQKLSADMIEAIRMVTNISSGGEPRVFALLCGGVKLDETLVDSSLESFTQRAATRCYLHPMNAAETRYYIQETIRSCGADPESTINDGAISAIHHACCGVPRLINQLVTQAIDCAAEADQTLINEAFVDQAWAELQQLPSPMVDEPSIGNTVSTIEFGELSDSCGPISQTSDSDRSIQWCDDESTEHEPAASPSVSPQHRFAATNNSSSLSGIQIETSSALWVDDPDNQPRLKSQFASSASLPHVKMSSQPPIELFGQFDFEEEIPVGNGFAIRQIASGGVPANLESLLQQEIVGGGSTIPVVDRDPKLIRINADCELDDCELDNADFDVASDDSDLLVIEDEVAVLPMNKVSTNSTEGQIVSVDFQAMLSKMRGTN